MVVLKKVKCSTLMETLVATVLIVVIFMISSMILNNLFANTQSKDTGTIEAHLSELQYLYKNQKISIPFRKQYNGWEISIHKAQSNELNYIQFEAVTQNRKVQKVIYENQ